MVAEHNGQNCHSLNSKRLECCGCSRGTCLWTSPEHCGCDSRNDRLKDRYSPGSTCFPSFRRVTASCRRKRNAVLRICRSLRPEGAWRQACCRDLSSCSLDEMP